MRISDPTWPETNVLLVDVIVMDEPTVTEPVMCIRLVLSALPSCHGPSVFAIGVNVQLVGPKKERICDGYFEFERNIWSTDSDATIAGVPSELYRSVSWYGHDIE